MSISKKARHFEIDHIENQSLRKFVTSKLITSKKGHFEKVGISKIFHFEKESLRIWSLCKLVPARKVHFEKLIFSRSITSKIGHFEERSLRNRFLLKRFTSKNKSLRKSANLKNGSHRNRLRYFELTLLTPLF